MATLRPPGSRYPEIVPLPFEPEHPPDAMFQDDYIRAITHSLRAHFTGLHTFLDQDPNGVFISSIGFICYDPNDLNVRVASDCTIAFGVDLHYIRERNAYVVAEMGKPPDFVLEVASPSTARRDTNLKREIYQQIGILEYWRFDPSEGDLYGRTLAGDRLVDGVYQPIEIATEPDGEIWGYSEVLGLSFCYAGVMLVAYNRETGQYLLTETEEHAAYLEAQARVRELEEQLRHREPEP